MPDRRLCGDWLTSYLELTSNLEAKETLHRWTGLICLSAAIQRKLFIEMQHGTIYPNLFVFIVAESAKARKSTATGFGRKLIQEAFPDMQIFGDDVTPQGLVKALNHRALASKNGQPIEQLRSDFFIISDELADFFGWDKGRASKMVILLTRTFMCPDVYNHITSRDSWEKIHNLYPVVLGCTDPSNLKVLPESAIGGLTGRLIWVIEKDKRHVNPGWKRNADDDTKRKLLREYLIHDLQRIGRMDGEMHAESAAQDLYDNWYRQLSTKDTRDPHTDAFYHRCHTTALQLASLLSVSSSDDRIITKEHMINAIKWIEEQLPEIKRVSMWSGSSTYEQQRAKCIAYLQNCPGGAELRTKLLKYMGMPIDIFDKEIIETLIVDETIVKMMLEVRGRKETVIRLTPNGFEKKATVLEQ